MIHVHSLNGGYGSGKLGDWMKPPAARNVPPQTVIQSREGVLIISWSSFLLNLYLTLSWVIKRIRQREAIRADGGITDKVDRHHIPHTGHHRWNCGATVSPGVITAQSVRNGDMVKVTVIRLLDVKGVPVEVDGVLGRSHNNPRAVGVVLSSVPISLGRGNRLICILDHATTT